MLPQPAQSTDSGFVAPPATPAATASTRGERDAECRRIVGGRPGMSRPMIRRGACARRSAHPTVPTAQDEGEREQRWRGRRSGPSGCVRRSTPVFAVGPEPRAFRTASTTCAVLALGDDPPARGVGQRGRAPRGSTGRGDTPPRASRRRRRSTRARFQTCTSTSDVPAPAAERARHEPGSNGRLSPSVRTTSTRLRAAGANVPLPGT